MLRPGLFFAVWTTPSRWQSNMRVRTRNSIIVAGVFSCAVAGFLYPMVYLQYFAKESMQHSADSAMPGGHTVRGAFLNSGTSSPHINALHTIQEIHTDPLNHKLALYYASGSGKRR